MLKYDNKEKSLSEWSKELNINLGTLYNRYYKGWSNEEILYGKNSSKSTIYLEHDGKKLTLKEWGRIVGVHQDTLRNRMKKGYEIEKILYGEKGEI